MKKRRREGGGQKKREIVQIILPAVVQLELGVGEQLVPVEEQRERLEVDVAGLVLFFREWKRSF